MRRSRYKIKAQNSTFALNITSMTDMFTIMLVFLLQTYSTNDVQIIPEKDINLPISNVEVTPQKILSVSISRKELKIEGRTVASLQDGEFASADLDAKDSNFIRPFFSELEKIEKTKVETAAQDVTAKNQDKTSDRAMDGNILMQADASLSYQVIRKVMYTASMAGFPKLKMATAVGE